MNAAKLSLGGAEVCPRRVWWKQTLRDQLLVLLLHAQTPSTLHGRLHPKLYLYLITHFTCQGGPED